VIAVLKGLCFDEISRVVVVGLTGDEVKPVVLGGI
jgi:hypothetical protein